MSDLIAEDRDTVTRRALRGDRSVLVRSPREARPSADVVARLRYGAATARALDVPGVTRVLAVEDGEGGLGIVLEDIGGRTLRSVLAEGRLEITEAVRVATQVARTLGALHARRVVHKSIEPSSILLNAETGEVKITNFDAASRLDREEPALAGPSRAGAAAYAAPEQTGRVNRAVDYRADLYGLGVTLYEMLTGHVPFTPGDGAVANPAPPSRPVAGAEEPNPIAVGTGPVPPERIRPSVPSALSDVVLKLLARNAEDRYQSAEGLVSDLNECLGHLVEGATLADFQLGKNDVTTSFLLPQALYGRDAARDALVAAFTRAVRGPSELFLVSGPPGVGKTALVNELRAPSAGERVRFCTGSGDPVSAPPYGALSQALADLCGQILAEGADVAAAVGRQLQDAVGPSLALVVDIVPALERLVPRLPPVPRLGPAEARDRFDLAFQDVLGVFAGREHPLALFIDDLQWVDDASLRMLEIVLRDPGGRHLLVIGAVDAGDGGDGGGAALPDRIARGVAAVREGPAAVHELRLEPLGEADVGRFVADALGCPPGDPPRDLAFIVHRASGGNPLGVHQILTWLHRAGLLRLDAGTGHWQCAGDRPWAASLTADPVALFDLRISALPKAAVRVLSIAACFGRRFDLATPARAAGETRREAAGDLWAAVEAGLIHPIGGTYRCAMVDPPGDVEYAFVHGHAHAAALARISPELARELRQRAGQQLLADASPEERRAAIFFLADTLAGPAGHDGRAERLDLAALDLAAAERARACNALAAATRYLDAGISLLPGDAWESAHPLAFALHRDHAECAYLAGRVPEAVESLDLVRARARTEEEQVAIDLLHVVLAHGAGDFAGAVGLGCRALASRDIVLPEREEAQSALAAEIVAIDQALAGRRVESLLDLPVTDDAAERGRVALLAHTLLAAAQSDPDRFRLAGAMIVGRALRHGHAPFSSLGYAAYGVVAGAGTDRGAELAPLALRLAHKLDSPGIQAAVESFGAIFTSPLHRPLRDSLAPLERAHADALAAGDLRLAGLAAVQRLLFGLMSGEDLYRLQARAEKYLSLLRRLGRAASAALAASVLRTVSLLTRGPAPSSGGPASGPHSLSPSRLADLDGDPLPAGDSDARAFASHWVLALQRAVLFDDYHRAIEHAARVGATPSMLRGHPVEAEYCYYHALALAGAPAGPPAGDPGDLRTIEAHRDKLAVWAEGSPAGFRHRHLLVAAEAARCAGDPMRALDLYDRAIEAAAEHQHPDGEGLAAELASRFHLAAGRRHVARAYLLHALEAYARWGADGKVADLRRRHAEPLPEAVSRAPAGAAVPFDLHAVLRASQALSAELVLGDLQRLFLTQALEITGASRGVLLQGAGEIVVEARRGDAGLVVHAPRPTSREDREDLPRSIVRHVTETGEGVVLEHAAADGPFRSDPYVVHARPRSVLCLPLRRHGTSGVLYLENNLAAGAFSPERCAELTMLAAQAAISLENAAAHGSLARQVRSQEAELGRSHADLGGALLRVKDAQKRLLVQEKLATLGGLTAGIAHEIKNPLNFINNFAESSVSIADELAEELGAQRSRLDADAIGTLEELLGALRGNAAKIHEHGRRADDIVRSMLEHSRGGSATARAVDLNALLKEYVTLAYQGFRSQDSSFNTSIEASYAQGLPPMSLVPQDMGRVFLNLINNACYAVHAKKKALGRAFAPALRVSTRDLGHAVQIRIRDNGTGIPAEVRDRIYQPFFTTKPTGDGTGLGLSISLDIVHEQGGTLEVETEEGQFTEFVITLPRNAPAR